MLALREWWYDFVGLFYPPLCLACGEHLPSSCRLICLDCQLTLPQTEQHLHADNAFTERFWGRVPLRAGAALYYYGKTGRVQQLIFQLKYHDQPEIGYLLGQWYGEMLRESPHFRDLDAVVPVPLHPRKEQQRGYNQSERFAAGLSESLRLPMWPQLLRRRQHADSQTKKGRLDRLTNTMEAFVLHQADRAAGQHLLLVDDVLTTGATLEACALELLRAADASVSMATIAIAGD